MPHRLKPSCSSCGAGDDLHLVTLLYDHSTSCGRILLYCFACRTSKRNFDVSIPIEIVSSEVFEKLYTLGKSESDKGMAYSIVFGH